VIAKKYIGTTEFEQVEIALLNLREINKHNKQTCKLLSAGMVEKIPAKRRHLFNRVEFIHTELKKLYALMRKHRKEEHNRFLSGVKAQQQKGFINDT